MKNQQSDEQYQDMDQQEYQPQFQMFNIMIDQNSQVKSSVRIYDNKIQFPKVGFQVNDKNLQEMNSSKTYNQYKIKASLIQKKHFLGRGQAGQVYKGIYKLEGGLQINLAIKSINFLQKQNRKQLLTDLRQLIKNKSPYITQFFTCYYQNGLINMVIQFMNKGDLRRFMKIIKQNKIQLKQSELATIAYYILSGLIYIHEERKLIHRDIKPQNILLNQYGQIKICDFGVSKSLDQSKIQYLSTVGTITYMAPQRFNYQYKYTYKVDIWSLGIILFQLATGINNPYASKLKINNWFQMGELIKNQPAPQISSNYSLQMRDFVSKCLQKDATKRSSSRQLLEHPWITNNKLQNLYNLISNGCFPNL